MHLNPVNTCLLFVTFISYAATEDTRFGTPNANHVFNAIHSSTRQWGSSLNHNGMSFFLATVPAGTQLYHGTSKPYPITGMQWLAFEPEHALIFARPRGSHPGGGHGPPDDYAKEEEEFMRHGDEYSYDAAAEGDGRPCPPRDHELDHERRPPPPPGHEPRHYRYHDNDHPSPPRPKHLARRPGSQKPLHDDVLDLEAPVGYLHTYVPKQALRLLYVDGLSAGKTSNGTLDTQDMLLLNLTENDGPMGGEMDRALGICNLTSALWDNKIDGVLRLEGGFEIILCDFEKHLDRTDVVAVDREQVHGGPGGLLGNWQYIKAITSRYHGIGGGRVAVDYDDFVSVFAYPDMDGLFTNDVQSDYPMPRLQNVEAVDRVRIRDDLTDLILRKDWNEKGDQQNWQDVADLVVQRYSKPLHHLHTNEEVRKDRDGLTAYLTTLLRPFIDSTARNATLETQRCIAQVVPPVPNLPQTAFSLAHRTLYTVTHHICDTLLSSLSIASAPTSHLSFTSMHASRAVELIDQLVEYLQWTTWKECGTCEDEKVCFIPIWPMGSHEDHANPRCLGEGEASSRSGYWGGHRGPPHKENKYRRGKGPEVKKPR